MESRNNKIFGLVVIFLFIVIIGLGYLYFYYKSENRSLHSSLTSLSSIDLEVYDTESIDKQIEDYKNIDEAIKNKYDEYYTNIAKLEEKINSGESSVKIAYLTFDDGPYELTYKVLDTLKANNVRATFFVLGKDGVEDRYKRIVNEGHTLANHTYYHNIGRGLYDSVDGFISQVDKLEKYFKHITLFE